MNIEPTILVDLACVCLENSMNQHALAIESDLKTVPLKKKDMDRLKKSFVKAGLEITLPKRADTTTSSENRESLIKKLYDEGVDFFKHKNFR